MWNEPPLPDPGEEDIRHPAILDKGGKLRGLVCAFKIPHQLEIGISMLNNWLLT